MYCEFYQDNELEVRCSNCGRGFSGKPEDYNGRVVCTEKLTGPGTDLETIFKWWAKRLGREFRPCPSCRRTKLMMNLHGKEWVRQNLEALALGIKQNADAMGHAVPLLMIRKWLRKVSE